MALDIDLHHLATPQRTLLRAFNARVGPGGVLAVMGPSGSGKSSLLAWVAGLLAPPLVAQGTLRLHGRDLTRLPVAERRIGLMFQGDFLFAHLSVLDNLLFALPPGRRAARQAQAEAALAQAGLAGLGARAPHSLSGGQRARVALLRALLAQPQALLLDEPFSRLDAALRERTREWVFAMLRERGVPTLLVTHDPADVPHGAQLRQLADGEHGHV